jgi:hypothetical protein
MGDEAARTRATDRCPNRAQPEPTSRQQYESAPLAQTSHGSSERKDRKVQRPTSMVNGFPLSYPAYHP